MAQVNNFDGGLSLRIDPSLIKINEAQRLVNVEPNPVVLQSAKSYTSLNTPIADSFYRFKDTWVSDNDRDYVEYEDKLYFTSIGTKPQKYDAIKSYNLGIAKPEPTLAFDESNVAILDHQGEQYNGLAFSTESILEQGGITFSQVYLFGSDLPEETLTYKIAYIKDDINVFAVEKTVVNHDGFATQIFLPKFNGLKVRLYRSYNGTFYKLADLTLDRAITITDESVDISLNEVYTEPQSAKVTLQYTVTYYNKNDGTESAPMKYSNELVVTAGRLNKISNIPVSDDPQVTHRRLYRLGGNLISMSLVAELENSVDFYYDYTSDIEATDILTSADHYPPEEAMHSLVEAYSIFFGIVGNEIRFSEIDEPNVWPPENSIKLGKNGTGLLPIPQGILIFTATETYLLNGTNKSQFSRILVTKRQGCLTHKSCQVVKNAPLWVSHDGICTLQNGYVQVLSKPLLGKTSFSIKQSEVYDEQYILLKDDGSLFILDLRSGFRFYEHVYDAAITGLGSFEGVLYFVASNNLCTAFTGSYLPLTYTSPVFIDGNHSEVKLYNNVYIRAKGTFLVTMFIDNELALSKNIEGNDTFDLTPPTDKQRGYDCHFEITGKGTIYTIEIKQIGRQNGV